MSSVCIFTNRQPELPDVFYMGMKGLDRLPVLKLLLPFISGVVAGSGLSASAFNFFAIFFFSSLSLVLLWLHPFKSFGTRFFYGWVITLHFFNSGSLSACLYRENEYLSHFTRQLNGEWMIARVDGMLTEKSKSQCLPVEVEAVYVNANWMNSCGQLLLYSRKGDPGFKLPFGERIVFRIRRLSVIEQADGPWARLNHHRQQYARAFPSCLVSAGSAKGVSFRGLAFKCRSFISANLKKQLNGAGETAVAIALLIGEEMRISDDVMKAYSATGTLHVLSVSGMHVGLVFYLLGWMLKPLHLFRPARGLYYMLLILMIWFYAFMAGAVPSVVRASAMFTIALTATWLKRETGGMSILMSSMFLLLLFNPYSVFEPGLQLSFFAVFGILWLQPGLASFLGSKGFLMKQGGALLTVSLAAQVMTFPVSLYYSGVFPNYFLPANLVVVPLSSLAIYSLLLQLALSPFDQLNGWLAAINPLLLRCINKIAAEMASWPFAVVEYRPGLLQVGLIFAALILIVDWLSTRTFRRILQLLIVCILAALIQITNLPI